MAIEFGEDYTKPREVEKQQQSRPQCPACGKRLSPYGGGNRYLCLNPGCHHGREGNVIKRD